MGGDGIGMGEGFRFSVKDMVRVRVRVRVDMRGWLGVPGSSLGTLACMRCCLEMLDPVR